MMLNIGCLFIITMRGNCLKRLFKCFRLTEYDTTIVNSILRSIKTSLMTDLVKSLTPLILKKMYTSVVLEKKNIMTLYMIKMKMNTRIVNKRPQTNFLEIRLLKRTIRWIASYEI